MFYILRIPLLECYLGIQVETEFKTSFHKYFKGIFNVQVIYIRGILQKSFY